MQTQLSFAGFAPIFEFLTEPFYLGKTILTQKKAFVSTDLFQKCNLLGDENLCIFTNGQDKNKILLKIINQSIEKIKNMC